MCDDSEKATELDPLADGRRKPEVSRLNPLEGEEEGHPMTVEEHVKEYCACTSIHGVQYLVGRPVSERLLWIVVFFISFLGNTYLVSRVWVKWNESPVIVTFAETATPIWAVPFPAVTICPMTKYRASRFDMKSVFDLEEVDEEDVPQWIQDMSLVCDEDVEIQVGNTTTEEIYTNLRDKGPDMNDTVLNIKWKGEAIEEDAIIEETVTSDGICFTFNGLDRSEIFLPGSKVESYVRRRQSGGWTPEAGYPRDRPAEQQDSDFLSSAVMAIVEGKKEEDEDGEDEDYPRRVYDSGISEGVSLTLMDHMADFDYWCNGYTPGFKVILHNPASVPSVNKKYFILESGQQAIVGVTPNVVKTNENLRSYSPAMRQCYFSDERQLQHFKIYTQSNCEMECKTNYTIKTCGCANFHMPRLANSDIPICGAAKKACMANIKAVMREAERKLGEAGCHCLPSCTSMKYNLDVTQNKFDWQKSPLLSDDNISELGVDISVLQIYYTDDQFIASQRNELYGLVEFLGNCGGLIGLFSGFSVLSIVEIFYFLTLRGYNNIFRRRGR